MRKERKNNTAEEKVAILRRHLLDRVPISKLCDELAFQPTVFYRWQKEFIENGQAAFHQGASNHQAEQERIAYLEKEVQTKDEVLAELMAEYVPSQSSPRSFFKRVWAPPDMRDQLVDFVRRWSEKTEIGAVRFIGWLEVTPASSTTGGSATAASTNTTLGFPGISGWKTGRSRPSSTFISRIP